VCAVNTFIRGTTTNGTRPEPATPAKCEKTYRFQQGRVEFTRLWWGTAVLHLQLMMVRANLGAGRRRRTEAHVQSPKLAPRHPAMGAGWVGRITCVGVREWLQHRVLGLSKLEGGHDNAQIAQRCGCFAEAINCRQCPSLGGDGASHVRPTVGGRRGEGKEKVRGRRRRAWGFPGV